jgi:hypothetical protein
METAFVVFPHAPVNGCTPIHRGDENRAASCLYFLFVDFTRHGC